MKSPFFAPLVALSAVAAMLVVSPAFAHQQEQKVEKVTYAENIAPVLKKNCAGCHTGQYAKAGVHLDTLEHIKATKGAIDLKKPENSLIYRAVSGDKATEEGKRVRRMPPGPKPLDNKTIALIKTWIEQGAK